MKALEAAVPFVAALPWGTVFTIAYAIWLVGASILVLLQRRPAAATLAWLFAFAAIPFVSGLYYVVFGPRKLKRRRLRYEGARGGLAADVRKYLHATRGASCPDLPGTAGMLATVIERLRQGRPSCASSIRMLDDGDAALDALERSIDAAADHVHLEFYIWEADATGTRVRDALVRAARRGVEVRALHDAVGSQFTPRRFWTPLVEAGGRALAFNPLGFSLKSINFANFRTHRKIVVIDGLTGYIGGNNLHDNVCRSARGEAAWRDQHVAIEGEPVRRLQRVFLENWVYAGGRIAIDAARCERYFPRIDEAGVHPVQVVASGPDDDAAAIHAFYLAAIGLARRRVWIETPYLIPDESLESALRIAVLRGVDVQVIVPERCDSLLVQQASLTYCGALVQSGVQVWRYGPPMLHAKTAVVDDDVAIVGTANLDNRSFRLNFEVAAAFYDRRTVDHLADRFAQDRAASVRYTSRRIGTRIGDIGESIARLFSPIL